MKKILTIAGSDCSGGAGIQADIKTITVHKMYAMSVITALTAQNTTGVYGIREADAEFVGDQMDCIFTDIRPDAVKIGMVPNEKIIRVIAEKLRRYQAEDVVLDPVMISTSGSRLMSEEAADCAQGFSVDGFVVYFQTHKVWLVVCAVSLLIPVLFFFGEVDAEDVTHCDDRAYDTYYSQRISTGIT